MKVTFILRGRPGLGHVTPGLAIAAELQARGCEIQIITYSNGAKFLRNSSWKDFHEIEPQFPYYDWPGLDLYDDGLRKVLPLITSFAPDLVIFGGEYLLGPLKPCFNRPTAIIFNPEIFEDCERNKMPGYIFKNSFDFFDYLIPLTPITNKKTLRTFADISNKATSSGPFRFNLTVNKLPKSQGRIFLIANGGGVSFPENASSYSQDQSIGKKWLEETEKMTFLSAKTVVDLAEKDDEIYVFSCLSDKWNTKLIKDLEAKTKAKIQVKSPSMNFYSILQKAFLVVSRGGAGFISDLEDFNGYAIIWKLSGHEEQEKNTSFYLNENISVCFNQAQLSCLIKNLIKITNTDFTLNKINPEGTLKISDFLISEIERKNLYH